MPVSSLGLRLVTFYEGLSLTAYQDQAGVWTIGYGHTGIDVREGMTITTEQANQLLSNDLAVTENYVTNAANPYQQYQFDAMVSLAFNIGVAGFRGSSVLRYHNAGNRDQAVASFLLWDKVHIDGVLTAVPGLLNRRISEASLYQGVWE